MRLTRCRSASKLEAWLVRLRSLDCRLGLRTHQPFEQHQASDPREARSSGGLLLHLSGGEPVEPPGRFRLCARREPGFRLAAVGQAKSVIVLGEAFPDGNRPRNTLAIYPPAPVCGCATTRPTDEASSLLPLLLPGRSCATARLIRSGACKRRNPACFRGSEQRNAGVGKGGVRNNKRKG